MENNKPVIMLLEDDGYIGHSTRDFLYEDYGEKFSIEHFGRIDQAIEFIQNRKNLVACIITDLNMDDEALGDYQAEAFGCVLAGWVWLKHYVFNDSRFNNTPCIIYSGFNGDLRANVSQNELARENLSIVDKGYGANRGYWGLREILKERLEHNE